MLDRPNLASAIGVPAAFDRLRRHLALGDRTLARLLEARPGLAFLKDLRAALQEERIQVTRTAENRTEGGRPCSSSN